MKIKVKKTKTGVSVSIRANRKGPEGVDLADAVMSLTGKGNFVAKDALTGIIQSLGEKGYRADSVPTEDHPEVILKRPAGHDGPHLQAPRE